MLFFASEKNRTVQLKNGAKQRTPTGFCQCKDTAESSPTLLEHSMCRIRSLSRGSGDKVKPNYVLKIGK